MSDTEPDRHPAVWEHIATHWATDTEVGGGREKQEVSFYPGKRAYKAPLMTSMIDESAKMISTGASEAKYILKFVESASL
jgi:hypothetical protein